MMPENPYEATLMIIVRQGLEIDKGDVCLSRRPGGAITFPSEKGVEGTLAIAKRGIEEEMGISVTGGIILPLVARHSFMFARDYEDKVGLGRIGAVLFQNIPANIVGVENGKDLFYWESMENVMKTLSWDASKFFWIIALTELLGQLKVSPEFYVAQFNNAPNLAQTTRQP